MMKDLGFSGSGNRFVTRFEAGQPIFASQLNDMTAGLGVIMPQPSVGGSISTSFTSTGTVVTALPSGDSGYGLADNNPEQFKCRIWTVPQAVGDPKHYLQIARGNVTTTGSGFPFTQGDGPIGNNSQYPNYPPYFTTPAEQVCIFDAAISPTDSRNVGTNIDSVWFANGGNFELKTEDVKYYVTVSFFDYNDRLNWYTGNTIYDSHVPWVSIVKGNGSSYDSIFTLNCPHGVMNYVPTGTLEAWGAFIGDPGANPLPIGSGGLIPTQVGYAMKVIARIEWDSVNEIWKIRQEMVGPIDMGLPVIMGTLFNPLDNAGDPGVYYGNVLADKFSTTIGNFSYINLFKDSAFESDSDLLDPATTEWWYYPKQI